MDPISKPRPRRSYPSFSIVTRDPVIVIVIIWGLFCLSLTGGIIYTAIHFIAKYW